MRLFAAFRPFTAERAGLVHLLRASPVADVVSDRLASRRFQERLRQYRFVVAPRGGGVDTHRFWEALYADAIPITKRTGWSTGLKAEGIPFVEVAEWDEVLSWTEDDVMRLSASFPLRPSANPWLWEGFWRSQISALVADLHTTNGQVLPR